MITLRDVGPGNGSGNSRNELSIMKKKLWLIFCYAWPTKHHVGVSDLDVVGEGLGPAVEELGDAELDLGGTAFAWGDSGFF